MHFTSTTTGISTSWVEIWYGDDRIGPPTPLVTFGQSVVRDASENRIKTVNTLTLRGKFIASPSGTYNDMRTAQENLKDIFSVDGKEFTMRAGPDNYVIAPGEYIASGIYPRVTAISIPEDIQVKLFDYEVTLEYDEAPTSGVGSGLIESYSDTWDWTENPDEMTIDITHNVSARGANTATSGAESNAYINARTFVASKIGLDQVPAGFPYHVEQSQGLLYEVQTRRTESVSLSDGNYNITEQFRVASGIYPWTHSQNASVEINDAGITSVNINGKVQGFQRTNIGPSGELGFDNAVSGWLNHIKDYLYYDATVAYDNFGAGNTLGNNVISRSVSQTPFLGTVNYSYSYTDDPAKNLPSGIANRTFTFQRTDPVDTIVRFGIPYRNLGSILQSMGTPTDGVISISANAKAIYSGDEEADVNRAIAQVESDINAIKPDPANAEFITLELQGNPQFSYDVKNLSATASVNYVFTMDRTSIRTPSGTINFSRYSAGS